MKIKNFFSLFIAFVLLLSMLSCQTEELSPDYAAQTEGVYSDSFNGTSILVTKTGENELTLVNQIGDGLKHELTVTITDKVEATLAQGVSSTHYHVSNESVSLTVSSVAAMGQHIDTYTLHISGDVGAFIGTK